MKYTFDIQWFATNYYKDYIIDLYEVIEIILNKLKIRMKRYSEFLSHLETCRD